jgi:hypothetical protein
MRRATMWPMETGESSAMSQVFEPDCLIDRRALLKLGGQAAAAGFVGASFASPAALARASSRWPSQRLPASAAEVIESSQFFSTQQLTAYGAELNRLGLRATGGRKHEAHVRALVSRLRQAGLRDVHLEGVPLRQWLAKSWSIRANGHTFPHTFYAPYSKRTGPAGVTAGMVYVPFEKHANLHDAIAGLDLKGKIAVFEVPYTTLPLSAFRAIAYQDGWYTAANDHRDLNGIYRRPWFNAIEDALKLLAQAGAVGTIGIWPDLPGSWARQYTPYDAVFRPIPSLWIDKSGGAQLVQLAGNGARATITLEAGTSTVQTHNVVGLIPGRSKEFTVLHTHTDGTNGMEENGQIAILAAAQYLARLPRRARERTIMVMLSTGHFAGGVGIKGFLGRHRHNIVPRMTSILTLEHLGCIEWLPARNGTIRPTHLPELGSYFVPASKGLVTALEAATKRDKITTGVLKPFVSEPASQRTGWPGEGSYWWTDGPVRDGNFITGPYGLITADLNTHGMVDYTLMRRKAMTAVKTTLQLAATSTSELRASAS